MARGLITYQRPTIKPSEKIMLYNVRVYDG
jgi:hypothetical protein